MLVTDVDDSVLRKRYLDSLYVSFVYSVHVLLGWVYEVVWGFLKLISVSFHVHHKLRYDDKTLLLIRRYYYITNNAFIQCNNVLNQIFMLIQGPSLYHTGKQ